MGIYAQPVFRLAGDRGLLVEYGDSIDPGINDRVRKMAQAVIQATIAGVNECLVAYCSLTIIYDPALTDPSQLKKQILKLEENTFSLATNEPAVALIPVCYGGEYGPDLYHVARYNNLTADEVIKIHTEPVYRIYMLGFTPGFPYLGGLPKQLHTPRLETPRTQVPAGSVGIANAQTGIYSLNSPGGWQLIGRTPFKLFSPHRDNPFLLASFDHLKFFSISAAEFEEIARKEES